MLALASLMRHNRVQQSLRRRTRAHTCPAAVNRRATRCLNRIAAKMWRASPRRARVRLRGHMPDCRARRLRRTHTAARRRPLNDAGPTRRTLLVCVGPAAGANATDAGRHALPRPSPAASFAKRNPHPELSASRFPTEGEPAQQDCAPLPKRRARACITASSDLSMSTMLSSGATTMHRSATLRPALPASGPGSLNFNSNSGNTPAPLSLAAARPGITYGARWRIRQPALQVLWLPRSTRARERGEGQPLLTAGPQVPPTMSA